METRRSRRKPGTDFAATDSRQTENKKTENQKTESKKINTPKQKESNFVIQGSILAVAGIIVRLIGMLYRIPMTNIIGDEGMGYYSTAFNVYNTETVMGVVKAAEELRPLPGRTVDSQ